MTYFIGDIHGQRDKLEHLLHDHHLIDSELRWIGGEANLWFMGDYVDRGPDGIGVIDITNASYWGKGGQREGREGRGRI